MDITQMTLEQLEIASNNTLSERAMIVDRLNIMNSESLHKAEVVKPLIDHLNILNERYHRILAILKKRVNPL